MSHIKLRFSLFSERHYLWLLSVFIFCNIPYLSKMAPRVAASKVMLQFFLSCLRETSSYIGLPIPPQIKPDCSHVPGYLDILAAATTEKNYPDSKFIVLRDFKKANSAPQTQTACYLPHQRPLLHITPLRTHIALLPVQLWVFLLTASST